MKEIPCDATGRELCPVCESELSSSHGHVDYPGLHFFMDFIGDGQVKTEVAQDGNGDWWLFEWTENLDQWPMSRPMPISIQTAWLYVSNHRARLQQRANTLLAMTDRCLDFIEQMEAIPL